VYVLTTTTALRVRGARASALARAGVQVIALDAKGGKIDLRTALGVIYDEGIGSLLVEGGGEVFAQCVAAGVVDEMSVFVAPVLAPQGVPAFPAGAVASATKDAAYMHTHDAGRDIWIHAMFE
jgi:diaminohydroxyphosphoribosylaminopyrimidine deaminase / 5-amino-6-(5-phosphoribosylamino)uracil reductase